MFSINFSAEREYRTWRRKAELFGDVDPFDDEDLDWCCRNNVQPEKFITDNELAGIFNQLLIIFIQNLKRMLQFK